MLLSPVLDHFAAARLDGLVKNSQRMSLIALIFTDVCTWKSVCNDTWWLCGHIDLVITCIDQVCVSLSLLLTVFSSLDMSRSVSVTAAGQCRLAPLIQVILDSSHLYDYTVKLLFKLHSCEWRTHLCWSNRTTTVSVEITHSEGCSMVLIKIQTLGICFDYCCWDWKNLSVSIVGDMHVLPSS